MLLAFLTALCLGVAGWLFADLLRFPGIDPSTPWRRVSSIVYLVATAIAWPPIAIWLVISEWTWIVKARLRRRIGG